MGGQGDRGACKRMCGRLDRTPLVRSPLMEKRLRRVATPVSCSFWLADLMNYRRSRQASKRARGGSDARAMIAELVVDACMTCLACPALLCLPFACSLLPMPTPQIAIAINTPLKFGRHQGPSLQCPIDQRYIAPPTLAHARRRDVCQPLAAATGGGCRPHANCD